MKLKEKKWIRFRIYVVAIFFLSGLVTVLGRAFQLMVLERGHLEAIAREGYRATTKLPPKRGTIYDREGHELALSVEVESIYAHPNRIKEKVRTAKQLARVLSQPQGKILKRLKGKRPFVWIERRIAPERAKQVKSLDLEGVGVISESRRYYPGKEIAAHLIGFVGTDNQGLEGLEKKYDDLLSGPQYGLIQMRNALGQPFSISQPILSGNEIHDLILTIDKDIQYKAEQALKSAVEKTDARAGQCLVMDPDTGELLAMAVYPQFNPNVFSKYRPYEWRNRTITDCFEPGSTIKTFLMAAGLEESVVTSRTRLDCEQGRYAIGNRVIHDVHEHGVLKAADVIAKSSNIGAVKIGTRLGYTKFYQYLRRFGFGSKTSDDFLGERCGFIRSPGETKPIDEATIYFGQGMTTTSLQLAAAMAAIANDGVLMRPYVVKAIVDGSGRVVRENSPKVVRRVVSRATAKKMARILEAVVGDEGTGPEAAIEGFRVAGKTGTAQKVDTKTKRYSNKRYVASFVGFVPSVKPKLVILVVIDEPKGIPYGGVVAGPCFKEVGGWALNYLRVNPQVILVDKGVNPSKDGKGMAETERVDQRPLKVKAELLPDFRGLGMREVITKVRGLGLNVVLEGTGLAYKQDPTPGSYIKRVSDVKVSFRPPA